MPATISPEETPAYQQTFPAPESGGAGSPAGPRRPIASQRVAPVATRSPRSAARGPSKRPERRETQGSKDGVGRERHHANRKGKLIG